MPRMPKVDYIVLGGTGLIGSAVCAHLQRQGASVSLIHSKNYADCVGREARVVVNCNGNAYRYRAHQDPQWDFEASVATVERSLFDIRADVYIYMSTVDVYDRLNDPLHNYEAVPVRPERLDVYGFHKWIAEWFVQRFATRWVIFRLGTVVGEGLKKGPLYDMLTTQPLHMSLDSELTFIDTTTIAKALTAVLAADPTHEIINLTGGGSAKLRDLQSRFCWPIQLAAGSETITHRYHINNEKMTRVMPLPTAWDVAVTFLEQSSIAGRRMVPSS